MRHLSLGRTLFCVVCCSGLAAPVWAQGPAPAPGEPAPGSTAGPPAPGPAAAPEPGSALAALLGPQAAPGKPIDPIAAAAGSAPVVLVDQGPKNSGFVVGASIGMNVAVGSSTAAGAPQSVQPGMMPGIGIGFKVSRLVFTVGAEFNNVRVSTVSINRTGVKSGVGVTDSTFLVIPGAQIALLRSGDGRVELLGSLRFGFGKPISETTLDPAPPVVQAPFNTSEFSFMYEIGPGVRYWAHPHFGINLLAGFRGDYLFQTTSGTFPKDPAVTSLTSSATSGLNGIFASLGGIGVF